MKELSRRATGPLAWVMAASPGTTDGGGVIGRKMPATYGIGGASVERRWNYEHRSATEKE